MKQPPAAAHSDRLAQEGCGQDVTSASAGGAVAAAHLSRRAARLDVTSLARADRAVILLVIGWMGWLFEGQAQGLTLRVICCSWYDGSEPQHARRGLTEDLQRLHRRFIQDSQRTRRLQAFSHSSLYFGWTGAPPRLPRGHSAVLEISHWSPQVASRAKRPLSSSRIAKPFELSGASQRME